VRKISSLQSNASHQPAKTESVERMPDRPLKRLVARAHVVIFPVGPLLKVFNPDRCKNYSKYPPGSTSNLITESQHIRSRTVITHLIDYVSTTPPQLRPDG